MKAKIYKCDVVSGNGRGRIYPRDELVKAVEEFNKGLGIVTFDEYPVPKSSTMDRIAAKAILSIEGDYVVAHVEMLPTPMGKIASQLIEETDLQLVPISSGKDSGDGIIYDLTIDGLVFPNNPVKTRTELQMIKDWLEDQEPLFEITDKY